MKTNFLLLLAILSLFTFVACGNDDDGGVSLSNDNIVGTWNLTTFTSDGNVTVLGASGPASSFISNSMVTLTFAADKTWTSTGDYSLTSTSDGTTETTMETGGIGDGTYSVSGGNLTLVGIDDVNESGTVVFTTNMFTPGTKLDMDSDIMETVTDPFFGLEITVALMVNMVLEQ